ncbi:helix-turn-helix domain-containing protein [Rhodococcus sp. (in: high G+C Gram-positive bacteria)]|uniref:helix-turn-helix domain-containing protein n=1 Tax=Rhodococcus sp. TaxID=1831 RepID=UPI00257A1922|nr:helix-turn-helix domain-containing protein [Rhodococcus sp. (in: high G+C Gram-positive bacteria)]
MSGKNVPRRLVSIPQAAEEFGVCSRTIRRYISAGRITGYRFGPRMIRVDLNEIDSMMRPMSAAAHSGGAK